MVDKLLERPKKSDYISSVKDQIKTRQRELLHIEVLIISSRWAGIVALSVGPVVLGDGDISVMKGERIFFFLTKNEKQQTLNGTKVSEQLLSATQWECPSIQTIY